MPIQNLDRAPRALRRAAGARVLLARLVAFGCAAAGAFWASDEMLALVQTDKTGLLGWALWALFSLTFLWIALATGSAIAGLVLAPRRVVPPPGRAGRVVLAMPVHQEDPATTAAALLAMGEALGAAGQAGRFEIFILSDTRDADAWVAETACFTALREALAGEMVIWYRRRPKNTGRKAGNLRDFVETWGGRYDTMIVLDADSVMSAQTLIALADRMEAEPDLGLLQTVPVLAGGETLWARAQQFAGALYGPVAARGVAAWQGSDGNYWGHNAAIRVEAFAEACGLPDLPGRKPFGGTIMSHDFVEAALLRRAGWRVEMDPHLGGSWEGGPPSMQTAAVRDRRWAQGNLQHLRILGRPGLAPVSRLHMALGAAAYAMSPLWLALLVVGTALTATTLLAEPNYFTQGLQLFPDWPRFDVERVRRLFAVSILVLLLPKLIGIAMALASRRRRQALGGGLRLLAGATVELSVAALYAPVLMVGQTGQIIDILRGRDSGWPAQARAGAADWAGSMRRHGRTTVLAALFAAGLWASMPELLPWLAPTLAGLLLGVPLAALSGSRAGGLALRRIGLMVTPEEMSPPSELLAAEYHRGRFTRAAQATLDSLIDSPAVARAHYAATPPPQPDAAVDIATAAAKIAVLGDRRAAILALSEAERAAVASHPALAHTLRNAAALRQAAE